MLATMKPKLKKIKKIKGEFKMKNFVIYSELFTNQKYNGLNTNAKVIYSVLLQKKQDNINAGKNIDEDGKTYVVYPISKIADTFNFSSATVCKYIRSLEFVGLIKKKIVDFRGCTRYYVKDISGFNNPGGNDENDKKNHNTNGTSAHITKNFAPHSDISGMLHAENTAQNFSKKINACDGVYFTEKNKVRQALDKNIICESSNDVFKSKVDWIKNLIIETISKGNGVTIGKILRKFEDVRDRLMKVTMNEIRYVIDYLNTVSFRIYNKKAYVVSMLYNAVERTQFDSLFIKDDSTQSYKKGQDSKFYHSDEAKEEKELTELLWNLSQEDMDGNTECEKLTFSEIPTEPTECENLAFSKEPIETTECGNLAFSEIPTEPTECENLTFSEIPTKMTEYKNVKADTPKYKQFLNNCQNMFQQIDAKHVFKKFEKAKKERELEELLYCLSLEDGTL